MGLKKRVGSLRIRSNFVGRDNSKGGCEEKLSSRKLNRQEFLRFAGAGAGMAALTGPLAACSRFVGGGGQGSGGGGSGSLQIAMTGINPEPIQVFINAFKEKNPDTKVNMTIADTDKYQTSIRTQLASGTAPDVFFVWPGNGNAMALEQVGPAGFIADLSDEPWADDIPERYESVTQLNGKTMILPTTTTLIGAITGKQIMEDLNLEAPGTWDELLSFCEKVKASGKVPIALGNATPWVTQLIDYALVPSTVYADNPDFDQEMKAGNATFANSGWRDAMEKYLELNDRGFFNENPLGTSYEQQLQLVANGDAAMAVHVSTSLGQVENYGEPGQHVVLPFPGNEDPDKLWIPAAAGGSFGINAEAENPKGAEELLRVMAEPENMNKAASLQGALPSIPNDQFEIEAALEPMMPFMEEGKTVPFMDQLWPNAEVQQVHFAVVQQLFTGEITIDEALSRMDEAYQKGS
jgi:raffinose/stachyose/melibiose transport system substrate-binding protein